MMVSYFIFVGCLTATPQIAQVIAGLSSVVFFLFAGFFISSDSIPVYYSWLKWLSPFKYAYAALLSNEFEGLCLCGNGDPDNCPPDPACHGDTFLSCTDDDMSIGTSCFLGSDNLELWYNVLVLAAMMVGYRFLGYVCLRLLFNQKR